MGSAQQFQFYFLGISFAVLTHLPKRDTGNSCRSELSSAFHSLTHLNHRFSFFLIDTPSLAHLFDEIRSGSDGWQVGNLWLHQLVEMTESLFPVFVGVPEVLGNSVLFKQKLAMVASYIKAKRCQFFLSNNRTVLSESIFLSLQILIHQQSSIRLSELLHRTLDSNR